MSWLVYSPSVAPNSRLLGTQSCLITVYRRVLAPRLGELATAAAMCWAFLGVPRLECRARSTEPSPLPPRPALSNGRALRNVVSQRAAQRWGSYLGVRVLGGSGAIAEVKRASPLGVELRLRVQVRL